MKIRICDDFSTFCLATGMHTICNWSGGHLYSTIKTGATTKTNSLPHEIAFWYGIPRWYRSEYSTVGLCHCTVATLSCVPAKSANFSISTKSAKIVLNGSYFIILAAVLWKGAGCIHRIIFGIVDCLRMSSFLSISTKRTNQTNGKRVLVDSYFIVLASIAQTAGFNLSSVHTRYLFDWSNLNRNFRWKCEKKRTLNTRQLCFYDFESSTFVIRFMNRLVFCVYFAEFCNWTVSVKSE